MSKQLLRFLLLSNLVVLIIFTLAWIEKSGGLKTMNIMGINWSSPVLIGMLPFLFSFIYLLFLNARHTKAKKQKLGSLDEEMIE